MCDLIKNVDLVFGQLQVKVDKSSASAVDDDLNANNANNNKGKKGKKGKGKKGKEEPEEDKNAGGGWNNNTKVKAKDVDKLGPDGADGEDADKNNEESNGPTLLEQQQEMLEALDRGVGNWFPFFCFIGQLLPTKLGDLAVQLLTAVCGRLPRNARKQHAEILRWLVETSALRDLLIMTMEAPPTKKKKASGDAATTPGASLLDGNSNINGAPSMVSQQTNPLSDASSALGNPYNIAGAGDGSAVADGENGSGKKPDPLQQEAVIQLIHKCARDALMVLFSKYIPEVSAENREDQRLDIMDVLYTLGRSMLRRPEVVEGLYWQGAISSIVQVALGSDSPNEMPGLMLCSDIVRWFFSRFETVPITLYTNNLC